MQRVLRIGTRDSQLAVWQATLVQGLLRKSGVPSELVYMKSEGDVDTVTPLYAMGVTGIFTKTLDSALINNRIDIAVHSMKDVPVQLAHGTLQAAVLERGSYKDLLVPHPGLTDREAEVVITHTMVSSNGQDFTWNVPLKENTTQPGTLEKMVIATSSIRRIAQWKNNFPETTIVNLRGNVNTRLRKLEESEWHGAIFAAAGLERIGLRPQHAIEMDWMLPAPAQGAIMVVCREDDDETLGFCAPLNHEETALCTKIERDFLSALMGGCSTPISALAKLEHGYITFSGNIATPDGKQLIDTGVYLPVDQSSKIATIAAESILSQGGHAIIERLRNPGPITDGED